MGRFKTQEERQRKKMEKKPMSLGNLAKQEDLVTPTETKTVEYTTEQKELIAKGAAEERQRILQLIFNNKEIMAAEYKVLMRHIGAYLVSSNVIAYTRGFNDIIKLILKEGSKDEKSSEQTQGQN